MRGLYIHIPFCAHICSYCDFAKKIAVDDKQIRQYLVKLVEEMAAKSKYYSSCDTIYIGGGTPNVLNNSELEFLLDSISKYNILAKEYCIECNPELITAEQVNLFKKYHINRVSLGMQTTNSSGLKLLNRHHTKTDVLKAVNLLKANGISNINIDLIYAYFGETLADLKEDLSFLLSLDIKHISAYSLILEKNTKLYHLYKEKDIDQDLAADMMDYIRQELSGNGYNHYEISNFAKPGYESKHNLKYWSKDEYIGLGMGACSYIEHKRITNSYLINKYLNDRDISVETLSLIDEKKEYIILGLRKLSGIIKKDYVKRFNSNITDDFNYQKLLDLDLLMEDNYTIRLTPKGIPLANIVFEEFI